MSASVFPQSCLKFLSAVLNFQGRFPSRAVQSMEINSTNFRGNFYLCIEQPLNHMEFFPKLREVFPNFRNFFQETSKRFTPVPKFQQILVKQKARQPVSFLTSRVDAMKPVLSGPPIKRTLDESPTFLSTLTVAGTAEPGGLGGLQPPHFSAKKYS